ncbi:MAG: hypothetical protein ACFFCI_08010, partial [Promethearchaeota archaeon]
DGSFTLNWTISQFAQSYSIYRNDSLVASNLPSSQRTYPIIGLDSGTYEFYVKASNEFGNSTSNTVTATVKIFPISYFFDMEDTIALPSDLARFRIELENFNESVSAPAYNVKVNLSLYREGGGGFDVIVPPVLYPLENATFTDGVFTGINFTIVDEILYSGQGLILNGFVSSATSDIIIRYKWMLIVDDIVIYSSPEDYITVT